MQIGRALVPVQHDASLAVPSVRQVEPVVRMHERARLRASAMRSHHDPSPRSAPGSPEPSAPPHPRQDLLPLRCTYTSDDRHIVTFWQGAEGRYPRIARFLSHLDISRRSGQPVTSRAGHRLALHAVQAPPIMAGRTRIDATDTGRASSGSGAGRADEFGVPCETGRRRDQRSRHIHHPCRTGIPAGRLRCAHPRSRPPGPLRPSPCGRPDRPPYQRLIDPRSPDRLARYRHPDVRIPQRFTSVRERKRDLADARHCASSMPAVLLARRAAIRHTIKATIRTRSGHRATRGTS